MNPHPSHWIKQVQSIALRGQEIPMWGAFPAFPWDFFSEKLASQLEINHLKISAKHADWKEGQDILSGMGASPLQLGLELAPLNGHFFLVFSVEDFSKFSAWAIYGEKGTLSFSDLSLQKGLLRYLCAESIEILEKMDILHNLRARLVDIPLTQEEAYCIDIAIEKEGETIWARVISPPLFQKSLKDHYNREWSLSIPSTLYSTFFTSLSLRAGHVTLSQSELNAIQPGDFLLLDSCSYSPTSKRGTLQLELEQIPLFQTKINEETIKILDYADYFEEHSTMDDETNENLSEEGNERTEHPPEESFVSPKKVPVTLTVEVAELKMSLDRLLKLKPGNFLELTVQVEKGVHLVANGQRIGKGELLQIEDVIGVKITKLGQ